MRIEEAVLVDTSAILAMFNPHMQDHDQEVDLADAALVHLANRENIRAIFTLDRRHFRLFTRSDGSALRLLPDDFEG